MSLILTYRPYFTYLSDRLWSLTGRPSHLVISDDDKPEGPAAESPAEAEVGLQQQHGALAQAVLLRLVGLPGRGQHSRRTDDRRTCIDGASHRPAEGRQVH